MTLSYNCRACPIPHLVHNAALRNILLCPQTPLLADGRPLTPPPPCHSLDTALSRAPLSSCLNHVNGYLGRGGNVYHELHAPKGSRVCMFPRELKWHIIDQSMYRDQSAKWKNIGDNAPGRCKQTQSICITFVQCWATSETLDRSCTNVISMFCVRWDVDF